jgi:hypothetical protein
MRFTPLVLAIALLAACSSDPEPGESCTTDDDCGSLDCHCVVEDGAVPGVCSETCTDDADCATLGDGYSCSVDFCTNVSVCLRLTE